MSDNSQPHPLSPQVQSAHPAVNVTLAIDEEVEHAPPSILLTLAFCLSFVPLIGLLGGGYAVWDLWAAARRHQAAHGLAYAALAIQLLYAILALTVALVIFQLPLVNNSALNKPSVQVGQRFLSAVRIGDGDQVASFLDSGIVPTIVPSLPSYKKSIQVNPQIVSEETLTSPKFQDASLAMYKGHNASLQVWRVGNDQASTHYFVLTLAQNAQNEWRVVGVLSLDAGGDQTARTIAHQVRNNTFGQ